MRLQMAMVVLLVALIGVQRGVAEEVSVQPSLLGTYKTGIFDESAAEIVVHDAKANVFMSPMHMIKQLTS
ncbi:MAG: hypothetical protein ABJN57_11540 [Hyphomicrobiales bacterium]